MDPLSVQGIIKMTSMFLRNPHEKKSLGPIAKDQRITFSTASQARRALRQALILEINSYLGINYFSPKKNHRQQPSLKEVGRQVENNSNDQFKHPLQIPQKQRLSVPEASLPPPSVSAFQESSVGRQILQPTPVEVLEQPIACIVQECLLANKSPETETVQSNSMPLDDEILVSSEELKSPNTSVIYVPALTAEQLHKWIEECVQYANGGDTNKFEACMNQLKRYFPMYEEKFNRVQEIICTHIKSLQSAWLVAHNEPGRNFLSNIFGSKMLQDSRTTNNYFSPPPVWKNGGNDSNYHYKKNYATPPPASYAPPAPVCSARGFSQNVPVRTNDVGTNVSRIQKLIEDLLKKMEAELLALLNSTNPAI